jgi:hypothetical protein
MDKVRIKVVSIGHLPANFNRRKVEKWNSSFFEITGEIERLSLSCNSDGPDWEFTDAALEHELPREPAGDFLIAIVGVPIENNWYTRIVGRNKVVFTFHEIREILDSSHIPLENVIYRLLYAYALPHRAQRGGTNANTIREFSHDETRRCLFDMNGIKSDIVYSCSRPIICPECAEKLKRERVSENIIRTVRRELRAIRKPLFYRFTDFIKKYPLWSLVISGAFAIVLGFAGSLLATLVYESLIKRSH